MSALGVHDMLVEGVLADRSHDIIAVGPITPVTDAVGIMTRNSIGAAAVVDIDDEAAGIQSESGTLKAVDILVKGGLVE